LVLDVLHQWISEGIRSHAVFSSPFIAWTARDITMTGHIEGLNNPCHGTAAYNRYKRPNRYNCSVHDASNPETPVTAEFRAYSTIEVARRLGVSLQTVQRWVDAGHLKAWKTLGGHRRIDADSAESLFKSQGSVSARTDPAVQSVSPPVPLQVLVVDDDPVDLELTLALVRRALPDAEIMQAEDGFQALLAVGQCVPDILVTDINMPHMDGFEMIRSLVGGGALRPAKIVAVSSLSPSDLEARGRLLPDVQFMSKPVDEARFAKTLHRIQAAAGGIATS
jgi:excisionase family DNA binding protein